MKFNERLKELRKRQNASQKAFANIMDVARSQYQKYEYGQHMPTLDKISKLCRHLNISGDFLLGLSDEVKKL